MQARIVWSLRSGVTGLDSEIMACFVALASKTICCGEGIQGGFKSYIGLGYGFGGKRHTLHPSCLIKGEF